MFLEPYREAIKTIIHKIGFNYDINIIKLEIPDDHIHMVVRIELKISPNRVMQVVKSISAREFYGIFPEIKKQCFWGGKLWTQSYYVETIKSVTEESL